MPNHDWELSGKLLVIAVSATNWNDPLQPRVCLGNKAQAVSQITMHAIVAMAAKVMRSFSKRVAMRLKALSRVKSFSMRWRST
jgi:hypothetical protein